MDKKIIVGLKYCTLFIAVTVIGVICIRLINHYILKLNVLELCKTDMFASNDGNDVYYNYMKIMENNILNEEYDKVYPLWDEYNFREKFNADKEVFKEKMKDIYSSESEHVYTVINAVKHKDFVDIFVKLETISKDINCEQLYNIEFIIRQYKLFDYKIFMTTTI